MIIDRVDYVLRPRRAMQFTGNFGNFRHEQWFSGALHTRTQKNNFGTLKLMGRRTKPVNPTKSSQKEP